MLNLWTAVRVIVYLILLGFSFYETGLATIVLLAMLILMNEASAWYIVKETDELKDRLDDKTGSD